MMRYNRISRTSSLQTRTSRWYHRPCLQRGRMESAFVTLHKEWFKRRWYRPCLQRGRMESAFVTLNKKSFMMRYNRISQASSLQTRTRSSYRPRLQRGRMESAFVTLNDRNPGYINHRLFLNLILDGSDLIAIIFEFP
jgi:hypothetical protein